MRRLADSKEPQRRKFSCSARLGIVWLSRHEIHNVCLSVAGRSQLQTPCCIWLSHSAYSAFVSAWTRVYCCVLVPASSSVNSERWAGSKPVGRPQFRQEKLSKKRDAPHAHSKVFTVLKTPRLEMFLRSNSKPRFGDARVYIGKFGLQPTQLNR